MRGRWLGIAAGAPGLPGRLTGHTSTVRTVPGAVNPAC